jgi:beta-phosphoglucomutase-like phosphatase (HAD superfamily)
MPRPARCSSSGTRLRAAAVATPGLTRLITALQAAGVPLALASSSSLAEIDAVVAALGVGPVLRAIASGEEVPRHKPAPDVYRLAIRRLGAGPAGVLAIEDSLPHRRASHGLRAVRHSHRRRPQRPHVAHSKTSACAWPAPHADHAG